MKSNEHIYILNNDGLLTASSSNQGAARYHRFINY